MSDAMSCPQCGRQVPSLSPGGLCPKCMLELGLNDSAEAAATSPYSPAPSFTPPSPDTLASLFPEIEIAALIGQGGMGAVYRGRQKRLDRQVAIKILPPEIGRDAAFAERFSREARALARLSHPNIVTIHDVGQAGEFYYFVMEYVDGTNLRDLIRSRQIEPLHALSLVQQICDALSYAHSIGIVHRDIKPENILVDRAGKVKIADFGLAKLVGTDAHDISLTGSEQVMGTWRYMAPEQLEGSRDVDHRADIYSLGVVFYELLTGEVPMGRFRPPSEKVQIDVRVDEVVLKSLEREPERRYQHASQVKTDVERCARQGSGINGLRSTLHEQRARGQRQRVVKVTLLIGGILMATLLLAFVGWLMLATNAPAGGQAASDEEQRIEQAETLSGEGWSLWQQRKFSDAIPKFERAVALDPQSANAWNGLGWANFNSGRSDEAIRAFEKAVGLEPDHPAALNGLGQAYYAAGDISKAEKYLLKAAPQASAAAYGLGRLYLLTGKYAQAEKWLQKAMGDSPNDPTLQQMLAAARDKKLPDALRQQIAPAGKQKPMSPATARGWQQFNEGKLRSAELAFRRALAKDPEEAAALNGLGFCLLTSGKWAEAKRYFEKCLEIDPDAAGAMNGLARCLKAEGKVDEAIAVWEEMRKRFPGPNAAAVGLATTYLERGEHAKALPLYEELVAAAPDNEQFREGLEAARKGAETTKK